MDQNTRQEKEATIEGWISTSEDHFAGCLSEIARLLKEKKVALFCGAGISKNSGLPLANELKESILEKLITIENATRTKKDIHKILCSDLPFEVFMEAISENIDISPILDIFGDGKPNSTHIMIAKLAKCGYLKTILTTNFDPLIETALENERLRRDVDFEVYYNENHFSGIDFGDKDDAKIRIFKIHGSVEEQETIRTTLKTVSSKTLSEKRMLVIRHLFSIGKHKRVLVLGYSCSDVFDITPQILSLTQPQKEIVFVEHSSKEKIITDIKAKKVKNPFKGFTGIIIKYDTDELIKELWNSFEDIIRDKYILYKFEADWRKYVDRWSNDLLRNRAYLKGFIAGRLFHYISDFSRAVEYLEKSLTFSKRIGNKVEQARCYGDLGNAYYGLGDFKRNIEYQEMSLQIRNKIEDRRGISKCYAGLGLAYEGLGDFRRAIEYYEAALRIFRDVGDKGGELCYANLAGSYYNLGNFRKAMKYSKMSLDISRDIGSKEGEAGSYVNLGLACSGLGDFSRAIGYQEMSLEIYRKIGHRRGEATCCANLGFGYTASKDFKKAIEYLQVSLEITKDIGNKALESMCYKGFGTAYACLGNFKKAIQYYLDAAKILEKTKQVHYLKEVYDNLHVAYNKIGDYKNADKYRKLANFKTQSTPKFVS